MLNVVLYACLFTSALAKRRSWINPVTDSLYGVQPASRVGHGMTSIEDQLFVFAGNTGSGPCIFEAI